VGECRSLPLRVDDACIWRRRREVPRGHLHISDLPHRTRQLRPADLRMLLLLDRLGLVHLVSSHIAFSYPSRMLSFFPACPMHIVVRWQCASLSARAPRARSPRRGLETLGLRALHFRISKPGRNQGSRNSPSILDSIFQPPTSLSHGIDLRGTWMRKPFDGEDAEAARTRRNEALPYPFPACRMGVGAVSLIPTLNDKLRGI
jgi:hypothetical protein